MKTVFMVPSWYSSNRNPNSGIFFKDQAKVVRELGIEVVVLYVEIKSLKHFDRNIGISFKHEDGIPTYRFSLYSLPYLKNQKVIWERCLDILYKIATDKYGHPDLIHAHSAIWAGVASKRIAKIYNIPYIITEHSSAFARGKISNGNLREAKQAFINAEIVIAVSEAMKKHIADACGFMCQAVVPNVVDVKNFKPQKDITKSDLVYISIGSLDENKDINTLIIAFADVVKELPNAKLKIIGDGIQLSQLKQTVSSIGLDSSIHFLGRLSRENVSIEMSKSSVFVSTSRVETFSVVCVEAMAAGLPCIATKSGGPEYIVNDLTGILVDVGDTAGLSRSMIKVYREKEKYNPDYLHLRAQELYSPQSVGSKLRGLYDGIKIKP